MKKVIFIKNAIILTVTSLILRFAGVIFKVWMAAKVGSEAIGLYQLIFSVYVLAATFATSGICTAVTRLVADETALGNNHNARAVTRKAIKLSVLAALFSQAVIFFGAGPISVWFIGDARAETALKILSFSLIFMGIASCFKGFFLARRRALPPSLSQILEQTVRMALVMFLIIKFADRGISAVCAAILVGDAVAEAASCGYLYLCYLRESKKMCRNCCSAPDTKGMTRRIMHIAGPITTGRYLNSGLRAIENTLVPKQLVLFGLGRETAVSWFGMIKGMALPLLFFPSALLSAVSTLLITEISEAMTKKYTAVVKTAVYGVLKITGIVGYIFAAVFFFGGETFGQTVYGDAEVGKLIKFLSPIVPLMYLDGISDGMLKGLDRQASTSKTAVLDSVIRIILILLFLPLFGEKAFIGIMYFSNLLTCFINVRGLVKASGIKLKMFRFALFPVFSALGVTAAADAVLRYCGFTGIFYLLLLSVISTAIYILVLLISGTVSTEELRNLFKR